MADGRANSPSPAPAAGATGAGGGGGTPCHLPPLAAWRRRGEAAQRGVRSRSSSSEIPESSPLLPGPPPPEARKGLPQTAPPRSPRPVAGLPGSPRQRPRRGCPGGAPWETASPGPWDPRCPRPRPPPTLVPDGQGSVAPARTSRGDGGWGRRRGMENRWKKKKNTERERSAEERRRRCCSGCPLVRLPEPGQREGGRAWPGTEPRRESCARVAGGDPRGGPLGQGVGCRNLAGLRTSQFRRLFPRLLESPFSRCGVITLPCSPAP